MSMYKDELTEREEDRRLFFREQQLICEAYQKEEAERLKRQMQAYEDALIECGLIWLWNTSYLLAGVYLRFKSILCVG